MQETRAVVIIPMILVLTSCSCYDRRSPWEVFFLSVVETEAVPGAGAAAVAAAVLCTFTI